MGYAGAPALTLQRRDVTGVHDFELIGLRIQTADPAHDLWVPAPTEAYADARVRLAHWAPMTVTPFFNPLNHPTRHLYPAWMGKGSRYSVDPAHSQAWACLSPIRCR